MYVTFLPTQPSEVNSDSINILDLHVSDKNITLEIPRADIDRVPVRPIIVPNMKQVQEILRLIER